MADETGLTLEYIEYLRSTIRQMEGLLRSARRWPWKRERAAQLLYELAHDHVLVACNLVDAGRADECTVELRIAMRLFDERDRGSPITRPGYHDVQFVAAAFLSGDAPAGRSLAGRLVQQFRPSPDSPASDASTNEACHKADHATVALLAWAAGCDVAQVMQHAEAAEGARRSLLLQFTLWARCASAAIRGDHEAFSGHFARLARFVRAQVRGGDMSASEDRLAYLPGLLIVHLAREAGIQVAIPDEPGWPSALVVPTPTAGVDELA